MRRSLTVCVISAALVWIPIASAAGGNYAFDGGNRFERQQVTRALDVSRFDWNAVPARITIHIGRGVPSTASPGEIWLDADLLDAGMFAWGVVQHEYAHQVEFLVLDDADRVILLGALGGVSWCAGELALPHSAFGCERFASTLAWSYWQSPANCMRPEGPDDESAALPPHAFRVLVESLIARHG